MPRFERDDEFWEIEREGTRLRIRRGRIGEVGQQVVHTEPFEHEAMREFDERIRVKEEEGFRAIDAPREEVGAVDPELAAAVVAALAPERLETPEGEAALAEAWAVLGDWLASRGDVRGELVSIDETLGYVDGPGVNRLLGRRDALLAEWIPRWFGDFGKLDGVDRPIHLAWDHGFIAAARVGTEPGGLDLTRFRLGLRDLVPVLAAVLASPLSLPIQQLRIAELDPHSRRDLAKALPELRQAPHPALIRLELGGVSRGRWVRDETGNMRQREALARIGSLAPLATAPTWAPRLAALRIVGRELWVYPPLPQLRVLELQVPRFDEELRGWLRSGEWPKLERLWLRCTNLFDPWAEDSSYFDDLLEHLLNGSPMRQLGIQGPTALERLVWRSVVAPLELQELRLFGIGEASAETLVGAGSYFDGIERIVLEDARIVREWDKLKAHFGDRIVRCEETFGVVGERTGSHLWESLFDAPGWHM